MRTLGLAFAFGLAIGVAVYFWVGRPGAPPPDELAAGFDAFPLPFLIRIGLSREIVFAEYLGGAGVAGDAGSDYRDGHFAAEAGARLLVPVVDRLRVGGDASVIQALPISHDNPYRTRIRTGLALTYRLP